MIPMKRNALALWLLIGAACLPTALHATTCTVTAWDFYQNAAKVGWKFRCMGRGLMQPNGTLIPRPGGDVGCVGMMGWTDGYQELWITKPSWLTTPGWEIRRGWEFRYFYKDPDNSDQRVSPGGTDLVFSHKFVANKKFEIGIERVRFEKSSGDCGRLWEEAF
jgi:hypothetical protein